MPHSAVLLMDLQEDFLGSDARMPVDGAQAERIIATANAILTGRILPGSLPILVVNRFSKSDRIGNFFRHNAAIAGSDGARLDTRIQAGSGVAVFPKSTSSAFANRDLDTLLRGHEVRDLYILGVFAEGCVRSTAMDAKRHGYNVTVPVDAIGSNAEMKRRFATWSMRRAGIDLVPTLLNPARP